MSSRSHSSVELYEQFAALWGNAGAKPLDCLEGFLEFSALQASDLEQPKSQCGWAEGRRLLAWRLDLPDQGRDDLERIASRSPGIIEQTYRTISVAAPQGRTSIHALLNHIGHASQAGLRGTEMAGVPDYLIRLILCLLGDRKKNDPVYVPFDSSGWLPLFLAAHGWPVSCELTNPQIARIISLFALLGDWDVSVRLGDPIRKPAWVDGNTLQRFSHSAAILTFGLRVKDQPPFDPFGRFPVRSTYGESKQIAHLVAQTRGRCVVIGPEGFQFRTTGGEWSYKQHLIRHGQLTAVVKLPRNAFAPYTNVQTSLLLLDTDGSLNRDVFFLDSTDELSRKSRSKARVDSSDHVVEWLAEVISERRITPISAVVSYDKIVNEECNISVDRYVPSKEKQEVERILNLAETVEINDIAEVIRPQSLPSLQAELTHTFAEIGLQDIQADGSIRQPTKLIEIDDRSFGRSRRQRLEPGDVVLSVRGRIGAVGLVPKMMTKEGIAGWLASQAFVILRVRETSPVKPLALYRYLASPLGQGMLQSLSSGATVPMISVGDIRKLRIILPTPAEQREIELQHRKLVKIGEEIVKLQEEADELNASSWPMTNRSEDS